jgi:uridine kinase
MKSIKREKVLNMVVQKIIRSLTDHPLKVAIDGIDAAGKTYFSKELKKILENKGYNVIQASIDGFHNPRKIRYRRGRNNPEGYYHDSFNYSTLKGYLLNPLQPNGNRIYKTRVFDYQKDACFNTEFETAQEDAILLFDGVFLLRPDLYHMWDLSIFLDISFEESLKRGVKRDEGNKVDITKLYTTRYIPGQKLYFNEANPSKIADIVIRNNEIDNPEILFMKQ